MRVFLIDETTLPDESIEMLGPTLEGERTVDRFTAGGGRGIVLRFGLFYGPTARGTDEALRLARWRMSMVGGKPEGYLSTVHTDDVAGAAVAALDAPVGIYNAVEDEPVTRRDYLDAFTDAFGIRTAADADVAGPADERIGRRRRDPVVAREQQEAP
jgi:nucleoside-diphosphate-sugar epimerase